MIYYSNSPEEYINSLPIERVEPFKKLRQTILDHMPEGLVETMQYNMISYVIPHSIYPDGYHCNPVDPLPFMSIASQKNFISLYHMGIYSFPPILDWFREEYPKYVSTKLDMGKSCIRFKNINTIPYSLIGELCTKITVTDFIKVYDDTIQR